jgi:hypothetical protein
MNPVRKERGTVLTRLVPIDSKSTSRRRLFTTSREVAGYITDADLWWERVFIAADSGTIS